MRTDASSRRGQAAVEFAIGVFVFALVAVFLLDLAPVLVRALDLQSEARADAGARALTEEPGQVGDAAATWTGGSVRALDMPETFKSEPVMLPVLTLDGRLYEWNKARIDEHVSFTPFGQGPNGEALR